VSRKPLVREFTYGATGQVRGFSCPDDPDFRWVYVYDGVAKEKIQTSSGEVAFRTVFLHDGDRMVGEHTTVDSIGCSGDRTSNGLVWTTDPATGELLGQVTLATRDDGAASPETTTGPALGRWSGPVGVASAPQCAVDAVFHAMVTDLASAPRELINPDTGVVAGRVEQSLYGRRSWHGEVSCLLLFAGQYEDAESGWVYNRFWYYDPTAGVYGAQDPLGVAPRVAGAQGYVDNSVVAVDVLGLMACGQNSDQIVAQYGPTYSGGPLDAHTANTFTGGTYSKRNSIALSIPHGEIGQST
jgi:RHS repeat-associated protein